MDSLTRFWTGQEVYIMKVFLPIILGFLVLFIGLLAVSALSFWWRHYRLWHLGKEENRSDQGATRLKTLLAVTFGHRPILEGTLSRHHAFFNLLGCHFNFSG